MSNAYNFNNCDQVVLVYFIMCLNSFVSYHRVRNKSNTTDVTYGAGTTYPSGASEFTPGFQWGSCCSICSYLYNDLQIVVCPLVIFLLAIVLSVLRFKASGYHFAVFKLFLHMLILLGFKPDSNIIINLLKAGSICLKQSK